jgi:hypothetical protein
MIAKADSHQCVSSEVEDRVAPLRALQKSFEIPDVTLDYFQARVALLTTKIGAMTRMKIIEDYNMPVVLEKSVDKVAADKSQPTGDERPFHSFMWPLESVRMRQLIEGATQSSGSAA